MSKAKSPRSLHMAIDAGGEPTGHAAVMGLLQISKFDRQHLSLFSVGPCLLSPGLSPQFLSVDSYAQYRAGRRHVV
jgi:hypothetical protein